jgi:hypothetical protein
MGSGTKQAMEIVSNPFASPYAHVSLEEVLMTAGTCQTDPFCTSFGPMNGPGSKPAFAALVTAQDRSGRLMAAWVSEPMFSTPEAAQEHAEEVIGPEIWNLFTSGFDSLT